MEGLGTLYYPNGSCAYIGQWRQNRFNGQGTVFNDQIEYMPQGIFDIKDFDNLGDKWVKYEGEFKDDN